MKVKINSICIGEFMIMVSMYVSGIALTDACLCVSVPCTVYSRGTHSIVSQLCTIVYIKIEFCAI